MPANPAMLTLPSVDLVLRREMLVFFNRLQEPERNWPAVPTETMVSAVADTLVTFGELHGLGSSALRVLIHELQDRLPDGGEVGYSLTWRAPATGSAIAAYPSSSLDIYFEAFEAARGIPCKVQFSGSRCVLTYDEDDESSSTPLWRQWIGFAQSPGHYEMREPGGGHATLHRSGPDARYLEGYWREDGHTGMWRVTLCMAQ
jgi:hypothetical protein